MSNRVLGAVIGVMSAMVIAIVLSIVIVSEVDSAPLGVGVWSRRGLELAQLTSPALILVPCGIAIGVLFGTLIGSLVPVGGCSRRVRMTIYAAIVVPLLLLSLPYWPGIALFAIPITLFHAAFQARGAELPPLPTAIVRKSR